MYKKISLLAGSIILAFSAGAQAQTKWDLPSAYPCLLYTSDAADE